MTKTTRAAAVYTAIGVTIVVEAALGLKEAYGAWVTYQAIDLLGVDAGTAETMSELAATHIDASIVSFLVMLIQLAALILLCKSGYGRTT